MTNALRITFPSITCRMCRNMGLILVRWGLVTLLSRYGFAVIARKLCAKHKLCLRLISHLSQPYSQMWVRLMSALSYQICNEKHVAQNLAIESASLCQKHGFGMKQPLGLMIEGWALADRGHGIRMMIEGQQGWRAAHGRLACTWFPAMLAECYGSIGRFEDGMSAIDEGLGLAQDTGEGFFEAELHRRKGEFSLKIMAETNLRPLPLDPRAEAETSFRRAIEIARTQDA